MKRSDMEWNLKDIVSNLFTLQGNLLVCSKPGASIEENQPQTKDIFSDKWKEVEAIKDAKKLYEFQQDWFLRLYGFDSEQDLSGLLRSKKVILDTGIQRPIYWNFWECFWKEDWGFELSKSTSYDWYAPCNVKRFAKKEFERMIREIAFQLLSFMKKKIATPANSSGKQIKK